MTDTIPSSTIRLVIVEDDPLFRDLLRLALASLPGVSVIADYGDAEVALAEVPALSPDVLLLDIDLGRGRNGIHLGQELRRVLPEVGVLLFSNHRDPDFLGAIPTEQLAGWSYLLKTSVRDVATLERAIRGSAMGFVTLDPRLTAGSRPTEAQQAGLTERQYSLLQQLAQGYSNKAIAQQLCLSEKTIENQLGMLYRQLGIDTGDTASHARVQATLHFLRWLGV
jgi:DNA-binding NarL/FixJ family response regulator